MKIIKPVDYLESMLVSTTAVNTDANYSSATTYALGAKVTYNTKIYESLQSSNINHQPDTSPTWWLDLGADNKHAMFDSQISTSTTASNSLTVVFAPGTPTDTVALINVEADLIKITVRNGISGPIVYESTAGLSGTNVQDWYQYFFFDPLLKRTQVVFYNIPLYASAHITLEFTKASATVSIAQALYGNISSIGGTQYGATAGIVDYSRKETDEFGTTTFVERAFSKRLNAQIYIHNSQLNRVQSYLYSIRAKPVVWVASDDPTYEEALVIYGFYRDFSTEIAYPTHVMCSLEIEGLT